MTSRRIQWLEQQAEEHQQLIEELQEQGRYFQYSLSGVVEDVTSKEQVNNLFLASSYCKFNTFLIV